jgi:succinylarginine dihydrolase
MANGGGPACLRLRVVANPSTIDPRFMLDAAKADAMEQVISRLWPATLEPRQLGDSRLADEVRTARAALLEAINLNALV